MPEETPIDKLKVEHLALFVSVEDVLNQLQAVADALRQIPDPDGVLSEMLMHMDEVQTEYDIMGMTDQEFEEWMEQE